MKERPILFSAPIVRALLAGTKTQTRRVVKLIDLSKHEINSDWYKDKIWSWRVERGGMWTDYTEKGLLAKCPYGQPGDRLWVKETTVNVEAHGFVGPVYAESPEGEAYRQWGLGPNPVEVEPEDVKLRPSLFMTRKMARLLLEVTAVRVERLQEISEEDAKAEGIEEVEPGMWKSYHKEGVVGWSSVNDQIMSYRTLWESINGPGSWDANPWVWVVDFRRVTP